MLTVKQIERAAAKKAAYKLADATGLYLHVSVTGRKTWRYYFLEAGRAQTAVSSSKCNRVDNLTPISRRTKCAFW